MARAEKVDMPLGMPSMVLSQSFFSVVHWASSHRQQKHAVHGIGG